MSRPETKAGLIERAIVCSARNRRDQALEMNIKLMQVVIPELISTTGRCMMIMTKPTTKTHITNNKLTIKYPSNPTMLEIFKPINKKICLHNNLTSFFMTFPITTQGGA